MALDDTIAGDARQANAVIGTSQAADPALVMLALAGVPIVECCRAAGLPVVEEAFADRAYTPQGTLVSLRKPGAVLHDPEQVAARRNARAGCSGT